MAVFPSLEEVQWPIEVVNEDITGGEETFQETVGWIDGLECNWRPCNRRVYCQVFIIRKIPTFFCGAKAVGFREGCLKRPVILHRSSIEVKQKTGFVDR